MRRIRAESARRRSVRHLVQEAQGAPLPGALGLGPPEAVKRTASSSDVGASLTGSIVSSFRHLITPSSTLKYR